MENNITRQEVIEGLRKIAERGVKNPDALDRTDPDVKEAHERMFAYVRQEDARAKTINTPEAIYESKFDQATLETDAGFVDADYLDEVANEWLTQDEEDARDNGLADLADRIAAKIDEINQLLSN